MKPYGLALLLGWVTTVALAAGTNVLFHEDFEQLLGTRWQQVKFEGLTDYRIVTENSNQCLRGFAHGTASAFATKVGIAPATNFVFSWRWKIDRCPTNGSDTRAKTFDHAGRIFVAFDTLLGPPRAINYVWANHAPSNAVFNHPQTSRSRFLVLRTGEVEAGQWWTETRNLSADWARLFPGDKMPKVVAIGVFTNADGTEAPVTAWYDDLILTHGASP
jgi:hypothetical protein